MVERDFIVSAASQAALAASLVDAGVLVSGERGYFAEHPNIFSPQEDSLDGSASAFVRVVAADQAALDLVLARIPVEMLNRTGAPLRMVSGAITPKAEAWPRWAVKFALTLDDNRAAWEAAVTALSIKADATNAEKLLPDRWAENDWLTLDEPWVLRIVNQMRTTLGWTPAQRNQFITRIKNRATAQVAAAND